MKLTRRFLLATSVAAALAVAACSTTSPAADPSARAALAPTGTLRVGVYPGSPSSLVVSKTGERAGVSLEFGQALAAALGVPVQVVEFQRVAQVVDAIGAGQVDLTVTNATAARAKVVDFTPPMIKLELGYLASPQSPVKTVADVDRPGRRIGVTEGSTSQATLSREYRSAKIAPAPSLEKAKDMLRAGSIDAYATNKAILFEMADGLPGYRVLDGRWGLESLAVAIPKGREAGMPYLTAFAERLRASGRLKAMTDRAGLRGTAAD